MRSALRQLLLGGVGSLAAQALLAEGSGLAFDARDMSAVVKGHTTNFDGDANGLFTYSAPSTKYVRNSAGILVPGTTMRCDHDASGNKLGLLIEEQRTNLSIRSSEFGTSWGATSLTVMADQAFSPDGNVAADHLVPSAASTAHVLAKGVTVTATTAYAHSIYAKAGAYTKLGLREGVTTSAYAAFDLTNGTVLASGSGGTGLIEALAGGWYRCILLATTAGGQTTFGERIHVLSPSYTTGAVDAAWTGDGTSGLYVWGSQLEAGAFPTSYIPTAGSSVTRAADTITRATSSFPFSATAGILVVEARTAPGSGTHVLAQIDDGTANERIRIVRNSSNEIHCIVTDGGSDVCDLNLGAVANSTSFKVAFSWAANDFAASLNGGAVQTDTGGTLPTVTTLRLGSGNGNYWNSQLLKMRQLPRNRASDSELQAMAA